MEKSEKRLEWTKEKEKTWNMKQGQTRSFFKKIFILKLD